MSDPVAAGEFVSKMFAARTSAHILHLRTSSYAAHKALNEFYDGILGLTDGLAENLQGKYGILEYPDMAPETPADGVLLMRELNDYIDATREAVSESSDVQNIIDEIADLISTTHYKLACLS